MQLKPGILKPYAETIATEQAPNPDDPDRTLSGDGNL